MMKRILIVMMLMLSGCSTEQKTYYQLPNPDVRIPDSSRSMRTLWLEQVTVADYLSSAGLVYQLTDVKYAMASDHLWASPLERQLYRALISSLSGAMPGWLVSSLPVGDDPDVLNVTLNAFHGRYDGRRPQGFVANHLRPHNLCYTKTDYLFSWSGCLNLLWE